MLGFCISSFIGKWLTKLGCCVGLHAVGVDLRLVRGWCSCCIGLSNVDKGYLLACLEACADGFADLVWMKTHFRPVVVRGLGHELYLSVDKLLFAEWRYDGLACCIAGYLSSIVVVWLILVGVFAFVVVCVRAELVLGHGIVRTAAVEEVRRGGVLCRLCCEGIGGC